MRRLDDEKDDDEPEPRQVRASLLTPQLIFGNCYTELTAQHLETAIFDRNGMPEQPVIGQLVKPAGCYWLLKIASLHFGFHPF